MDNGARSPSKPDPRQRVAGPLFRVIAPLVRFVLRRGLGEPNVLLTVRGRVTGQPRSTPVAMWELGDRRFVQASFGGEVNWVRNIRASGEAVIRRGGWSMTISRRTLPRLGAPRSSSSSRRSRRRPPARGPNDRGALWRLCSHGGGG